MYQHIMESIGAVWNGYHFGSSRGYDTWAVHWAVFPAGASLRVTGGLGGREGWVLEVTDDLVFCSVVLSCKQGRRADGGGGVTVGSGKLSG